MGKVEKALEESRTMIESEPFKEQDRRTSKAFSRIRKLTCSRMIVFILKKSLKSIQLRLNEWFEWLGEQTVSSSAYTQVRSNLKHTALFIALNELMLSIFCRAGDSRRYQGMSSLIQLKYLKNSIICVGE